MKFTMPDGRSAELSFRYSTRNAPAHTSDGKGGFAQQRSTQAILVIADVARAFTVTCDSRRPFSRAEGRRLALAKVISQHIKPCAGATILERDDRHAARAAIWHAYFASHGDLRLGNGELRRTLAVLEKAGLLTARNALRKLRAGGEI